MMLASVDIAGLLPGSRSVVPSLKKVQDKTLRAMSSHTRSMNRASNISTERLTLSVDCDTARVEGDMTTQKKNA
jgi:hypothetical protein